MAEPNKMSKLDLFEMWKDRLGLADWTISFIWDVIPSEMDMDDVDGTVNYEESTKTAAIKILREDCYGDRVTPFDVERTIVHELLHLKLSMLSESGNAFQDRYVHQLIDDLAKAFVFAAREERADHV